MRTYVHSECVRESKREKVCRRVYLINDYIVHTGMACIQDIVAAHRFESLKSRIKKKKNKMAYGKSLRERKKTQSFFFGNRSNECILSRDDRHNRRDRDMWCGRLHHQGVTLV